MYHYIPSGVCAREITYDVVDGKQRLEAIVDFIEDKIALPTYFAEDDFIDEANLEQAGEIAGLTFDEIKKRIVISRTISNNFGHML